MVFASPLFLFLPLTLAAYFIAPPRWRKGVLLIASLAFYAWGEAPYVVLVLASVAFNWWIGMRIAAAGDPPARKRRLAFAIAGNLGTLAVFKYANFAAANVNALAPVFGVGALAWAAIPLPLGISFFTFHAISYVVDVYKRNAERSAASRFALYILLFPQLIAGPISAGATSRRSFVARETRLADFAYGVRRLSSAWARRC
jgi:alginate O-acetyltransferase complex protein AlgI